jgi:mannose/fructose/N-acetylgalactosamine-specific phosphotransferase system component IIC
MISQPIFSCQIIGLLVGNYEMGLMIGVVSQLLFLSYLPVGGAKIPDPQIAPNILVVLLSKEVFSIEIVGHWFPILIILAIVFMYITHIERLISTWYMKYIPFNFLNIKLLLHFSFFLHFILFYYVIQKVLTLIIDYKTFIESYFVYDGTHVFYFVILFSLGSLFSRYFKWGMNAKIR